MPDTVVVGVVAFVITAVPVVIGELVDKALMLALLVFATGGSGGGIPPTTA
jgi:hypothetical protein